MSSGLTRALLKLYPRPFRDRYGDELFDLQDELRAQGDVSRMHLIRDMLAGAVLVRPARRAYLMIMLGGVLVIVGLAVGGAAIAGLGVRSPASASDPQAIAVVPPATLAPPAPTATPAATSASHPAAAAVVQPAPVAAPPPTAVVQPAPDRSAGERS